MDQLVKTEGITKQVIQDYAQELIRSIEEGHANPIDTALQVKFMEDLITAIKERLRVAVIAEAGKYAKGEDIVRYNGRVQVKEAGVKYDYHTCLDPTYQKLTDQINELEFQRKEREAFLKSLTSSVTLVDEETGEVITIHPPQKKSTTTYAITWKA